MPKALGPYLIREAANFRPPTRRIESLAILPAFNHIGQILQQLMWTQCRPHDLAIDSAEDDIAEQRSAAIG